jgi:8-oxo-dGTP pyrophosphatase MutT (NUDIX family)
LQGTLITSIGSRVSRVSEADAQYIGLLKFSEQGVRVLRDTYGDLQELFRNAPWRSAVDLYHAPMTDMLQELIDRGTTINASVIHHGWIELDTPEDYGLVGRLESGELSWLLRDEALAGRPVISSGGVALRTGHHGPEVLLVGTGEAGEWRIPKGMVQSGETLESAAIREVEEETGARCHIWGYLGTARWPYHFGDLLHEELVHFFLMSVDSVIGQHDSEHAAVAWYSLDAAEVALRYENERAIVRLASARGGDI